MKTYTQRLGRASVIRAVGLNPSSEKVKRLLFTLDRGGTLTDEEQKLIQRMERAYHRLPIP